MMWSNRRRTDAARKAAERREREDMSSRLLDEIPDLVSLKLEIRECAGLDQSEVGHVRKIMVEHAPALFEMPCVDRSCRDGGHDLTKLILKGLKKSAGQFVGEHVCSGHLGKAGCGRIMKFVAHASYR